MGLSRGEGNLKSPDHCDRAGSSPDEGTTLQIINAFSLAAIDKWRCGRLNRTSQMSGFFLNLPWCIFVMAEL